MAKPRVFISSTFYDLKQVRADLKIFIEGLGYTTVDNNQGDIPYGKDEELDKYCYKEICNIDILVSIIGGRFGSESSSIGNASISQAELKTALANNKQVYIFIDKNVLAEYETYLLNKDNEKVKYKYIDDIRIYKFIEEIKGLKINNTIAPFETTNDIIKYLREQFAGLFQNLLEYQNRVKEVRLIDALERTASNLNTLVTYLSETNKDKEAEINTILMTQHPLIEDLKKHLGIQYNFYIIAFEDLQNLISARGFTLNTRDSFDFNSGITYNEWIRNTKNNDYYLSIASDVFDEHDRLKFFLKKDWREDYVLYSVVGKTIDGDDLPF